LICAPNVPSQPYYIRQMLELAQVNSDDIVYDLGCGDGRVLQIAVKEFGAKKAVGYELRTDIYQSAIRKIEKESLQDRIKIINNDLFKADISEATVITLYLTPEGNELLKPKLLKEASLGTRIVNRSFRIHGWNPSKMEPSIGYIYIYLYIIPNAFRSPKKRKSIKNFFGSVIFWGV